MVSLVLSEEVDTTWAFIRMIEHWNENEWWRPFKVEHAHLPTISGEVSTYGRVRKCSHKIHTFLTRGVRRSFFIKTLYPVYWVVLDTFVCKPRSLEPLFSDHINRDTMDNRLSNLRWVTASMNQLNKDKFFDAAGKLRSGVGVSVTRNKKGLRYRVRISYQNQKIGLGTYDSMEEADVIYRKAWRDSFEILG